MCCCLILISLLECPVLTEEVGAIFLRHSIVKWPLGYATFVVTCCKLTINDCIEIMISIQTHHRLDLDWTTKKQIQGMNQICIACIFHLDFHSLYLTLTLTLIKYQYVDDFSLQDLHEFTMFTDLISKQDDTILTAHLFSKMNPSFNNITLCNLLQNVFNTIKHLQTTTNYL